MVKIVTDVDISHRAPTVEYTAIRTRCISVALYNRDSVCVILNVMHSVHIIWLNTNVF